LAAERASRTSQRREARPARRHSTIRRRCLACGGVGWTEQSRGIDATTGPVTGNEPVTRIPEDELVVRVPGGVRVAVVHESVGLAVETNSVLPVAVEVSDERLVACVPEDERVVSSTETAIIRSEFVDDVEPLLCWSIDRDGVAAIAVEVSTYWYITWVAEEERNVGDTLGVRVS